MKRILTESQEQIVKEEIQRRDSDRENTYMKKFGSFKDDLVKTLDDFLQTYIEKDMGDVTAEDVALVRQYKPLLDNILHAASTHMGASVQQPANTNQYGFPSSSYSDNQDQNPNGPGGEDEDHIGVEPTISVSPEIGTVSEENDKLRDALKNTVNIVQSMEDTLMALQKKLFIFESLAGMSKDIINKAVTDLNEYSLDQLKADNGKVVHEYVSTIDQNPKGLEIEEDDERDGGLGPIPDVSSPDSVNRSLHEAAGMLGRMPGMKQNMSESSVPARKFVVPGVDRKTIIGSGRKTAMMESDSTTGYRDVDQAINSLQSWNSLSKFGR